MTARKEASSKAECTYVRPEILYRSKKLCLQENKMGMFLGKEITMMTAGCGVQFSDLKS